LNIVFIFNCFLGIQTRKKIESSNVTVNTGNQHLIRFIIRHLSLSFSLLLSLSHCTTYKVNKNSNGRKKQLIDRHCNKAKQTTLLLLFLLLFSATEQEHPCSIISLYMSLFLHFLTHTERSIPPSLLSF
jgi:hypothetical protein